MSFPNVTVEINGHISIRVSVTPRSIAQQTALSTDAVQVMARREFHCVANGRDGYSIKLFSDQKRKFPLTAPYLEGAAPRRKDSKYAVHH